MCIPEAWFTLVSGGYFIVITILFLILLFVTVLKLEEVVADAFSSVTKLDIQTKSGDRWKVLNRQGWKKRVAELVLCVFLQIPFSVVSGLSMLVIYIFILSKFTAPYTQLCYGYPQIE